MPGVIKIEIPSVFMALFCCKYDSKITPVNKFNKSIDAKNMNKQKYEIQTSQKHLQRLTSTSVTSIAGHNMSGHPSSENKTNNVISDCGKLSKVNSAFSHALSVPSFAK